MNEQQIRLEALKLYIEVHEMLPNEVDDWEQVQDIGAWIRSGSLPSEDPHA